MVSSRDAYFDYEHIVSDHLSFAFGITDYDSNRESIDDDSYATISAGYKQWGFGASGFVKLKTRNCTQAELHVNG